MVNLYFKKIVAGEFLWTDVPALWSDKVQKKLTDNGYTLNDDGTVTKAE